MNPPKRVSHQLTENVKLLQKVALIWQERVLLLKRSSDALSRPDCWDLPGGNSEWPSEPDQVGYGQLRHDACREVEEETGIVLAPEQFELPNLTFLDSFFDKTKEVFTLTLGWQIPITAVSQPVVQLSHEHRAFKWVSLGQLNEYDFGGDKGEFVKSMATKALQP